MIKDYHAGLVTFQDQIYTKKCHVGGGGSTGIVM